MLLSLGHGERIVRVDAATAPRARYGLAAALLSTSLLSAGCATVQSLPKDTNPQLDSDAAGLSYFLPTKLAKLTVTRAPIEPEAEAKALETATLAVKTAKTDLAAKTAVTEYEQTILKRLKSDAEVRSKQTATVERAEAEQAISAERLKNVEAAADKAKALYNQARLGAKCGYTGKLELLPAQADASHRYVAQLRHNWLRDDTVKLAVTPAGLLSSSNVVAADRTGDILVEIAGALAGLGKKGNPNELRSASRDPSSPQQPDCGEPQTLIQIFDPASEDERKKVATNLSEAKYPLRVGPTTADPVVQPRGTDPAPVGPKATPTQHSTGAGPGDKAVAEQILKADRGAIFYRSAVPVTLTLEQKVGDDWHVADAILAQLPQAGPISYIPTNASAFVKTVDDVVFTDGVIASWSRERPSEVLWFVSIPIKVATAMLSAPAQILSLRVDYSSKAKALAEQQAAEIASTKTLSKLQKCLKDADAAGTDGMSCLPPAP